ncbi:MAG TPA: cysteine desulfurase family protein [Patescibacteria group bacterium]|nr:cysteine desulfurase family protein [Patescibacteria group bacterium]
MNLVYLDNSATTKPHKEVVDEVAQCMEQYYANPSSAHKLGVEAEKKLKAAREKVAAFLKAKPQEIIFTSGGSEANNMAVLGVVSKGDHIITTRIEHPSVIRLLQDMEKDSFEVTYLDVDCNGLINLDQLSKAMKENTKLISIMYVNNEMGSIQPIHEIIDIVREKSRKAKVHIDAVQALGKISMNVKELGVDLVSFSAHKIHGPKGVGALYIKEGLRLRPLIAGGGQEFDIRSGTENLPGISGFGIAVEMIAKGFADKQKHIRTLKQHFIEGLKSLDKININSPLDEKHIDNILNVSFEGVRGEVMLHALEDYHIYVSTGSACSAKKGAHKNYVLPAMGLSSVQAEGAIRFSFSYLNTIEEIDYTIDAINKILPFLRRISK